MNRVLALAANYIIDQGVARHLRNATATSRACAAQEIRYGLALTETIGAPLAHTGVVVVMEWRTQVKWVTKRAWE